MAERALVRAILPQTAGSEEAAAESARLLRNFGTLLQSVPAHLLPGFGVLIRKGIDRTGRDLEAVANHGLNVDVEEHLQITRRLAGSNRGFLQIQRRAFNVPADWTQEWIDLVDEFGKRSPTPEYIVLMRATELEAARAKVHEMSEYLSTRGWSFKCCELDRVEEILGQGGPTDNLDVYGEIAVKLHPPADGYRNRPNFDLRLVDLAGQADLQRFIARVRSFARVPTADWPRREPLAAPAPVKQ